MAQCQRLGTSTSTAYMKHGCRCSSCVAWQAKRHARQRGPRSSLVQREDRAMAEHAPTPAPGLGLCQGTSGSELSNPPLVTAIATARTAQVPSWDRSAWVPPALRSRMRAPKRPSGRRPPTPSLPSRREQVAGELAPAPQDRTGVRAVGWGTDDTHWPAGTLRLACGHLVRMGARQATGTATLCPVCGRWERAEAWAGW